MKLFTIKSSYDNDDTEKVIRSKDKVNQWSEKIMCTQNLLIIMHAAPKR